MLLLSTIWLAAAAAKSPGYAFRASTHAEGTASGAISFADMEVAGRVRGEKARIDIEKSRNPRLPKGDTLLTADGGKTLQLIDPSAASVTPWVPSERAGAKAASPSIVRVQFESPDVKKISDGPGEKIAGWPTKHRTVRITYVTAVDVMGTLKKTVMTRTEELWTTPDLDDAGFAAWLRKDPAATGNAAFDKQIDAELSAAPGVPLKRVTTSSWKDADGTPQIVRTTVLVTELRRLDSPDSLFQVPAGYRAPPQKP